MRLTSAQIDQGILDAAAGIFATHGYATTSLQQIADAVGYSKAGLLHRFGSKEALHRAVIASCGTVMGELLAEADAVPAGADRRRRVLEVFARRVLERTGLVHLMLRAFEPSTEDPGVEDLQALGYRLVDVLDRPTSTAADRLRVVLALELLVNAALAQESTVDNDLHVPPDELVPLVVELALRVLED